MAIKETAKVMGDSVAYKLAPGIKRYALMDVGFTESRNGNFQFDRSLSTEGPYSPSFRIKVTIAKDFSGLQMTVTDVSGMRAVNIFQKQETKGAVEQYHFIIDNLIQRDILEAVEK
ncbi:DUF1831 domain-containing protein [Schleiferilactobacillus perolens]|jgi:hypothetical protein|uniref:Cysteine desulfurase n=1 Tax=Schleiferilactobacillus perolens DSM 12744 TaxID=1423792 RepID=A0A0R1N1K8_9LACO|nr:DUF1831 domain-containing protein [Schleiferilactobacillus perolens]KRL14198.1 hypothetical protein FD09_GL001362 [Schleiferilactobacillus perolens DSM 12744]MCI1892302.1 DUF1831 domain-containing protein [Schleiferilactobacillus harbinensis]MCI1913172.1 DUF1831 domain-containing protein [Schleiferilactobacillus harbinensis]MCI2171284.1 DUF1831 domain-containing protein [Schleiferilactobacillus perolens]